ncbi:MAG: arylsulfatase [Planctomycetota bacterium]|jgi:arylsulfatase
MLQTLVWRIGFTVAAIGLLGPAVGRSAQRRPNIVLIMADDVGYSDFGCYGGEIRTPNIDRLARDGMRFTQFYSNATCVPTRASLYTGLYPRYLGASHRIGVTPQMVTLAEALRAAGYRTSLSGKWHLGRQAPEHPLDRGFEFYYGLLDGCCNYFNPAQRDPPFEGGRIRVWADGRRRILEFPDGFYATDAITEHAIESIRRFSAGGKPFLVNVSYTAAHSPLHAKPADIDRYRGTYAIGWDELRRRRWRRQIDLGVVDPRWRLPPREPEFPPWNEEPLRAWNENLMAVYAAMVDSMDQGIGRILRTLVELGIDGQTVVMVLSDNGGCAEQAGGDDPANVAGPKEHYVSCGAGWAHAQNTPFRRYKAWVHEGGIATPLVVRWPNVTPAGTVTDQVGHVLDIMPTLLEIAAAKYPATADGRSTLPLEGQSFVNVLRGGRSRRRETLYWASLDNRAMRQGSWKLVWDQDVGRWELYDLAADRTETHDLAGRHPERVRQMAADWTIWAKSTGAIHQLGKKYRLKPVNPP